MVSLLGIGSRSLKRTQLAEPTQSEDFIYSARESLGNWICRVIQRELRDELLNREVFYTVTDAKILIEQWRKEYNKIRLHSALRY